MVRKTHMTPTPANTARRHRHFVAAPLVLAGLMVAWGTVAGTPLAAVRASVLADAPLRLVGGSVQGDVVAVQEGIVRLAVTGSVLVRADGAVDLESAGVRLRAASGIARVTRSGGVLTVEAVSGPVLARLADDLVAVPAGMRWEWNGEALPTLDDGLVAWWTARRPQPLPATRAVTALALSGAILPSALPLPRETAADDRWRAALTLPSAYERWQEQSAADLLADVEDALLLRSASGASAAILRAREAGAFISVVGRARLPALLNQSDGLPAAALALAAEQAQSSDDAFLLPLLPIASHLAFLPTSADSSLEDSLLGALLLPVADRGREALPASTVQAWSDGLRPLSESLDQPEVFRSLLRMELNAVIVEAGRNGWVERAERYGKAMPPDEEGEI